MRRGATITALLLVFVAAVASLAHAAAFILVLTRWLALAALVAHALLRRSLTTWIFVAMLAGAEVGHDLPQYADGLKIVGQIFIRLIKVIIAPLLFGTLVSGIAGHTDLKKVGRMGVKAIVYFELVTTAALFIGLAAINISKAGVGANITSSAPVSELARTRLSGTEVILHVFPENIAKSVADNQVLQVVVFSILFGSALAMVNEQKRRPMLAFTESLSEVMFKFTNIVMLFAPVGIFGAVAYTVGHTGIGIVASLAKVVGTLYVALLIFLGAVLLPIAVLARVPVRRFIGAVSEPATIAFATSTSEAALPRAMEAMEAFGVPRPIVAFVMPTGYSFNLDGSTLYLSVASIFVAQAGGMHLTVGQQLVLMLTLMLTSKGVAGVSRASLVILMATAASFGLPSEPVFVLLGIDPIMDMARTAVNVIGNCLATAVVARWEGELGASQPTPAVLQGVAQ